MRINFILLSLLFCNALFAQEVIVQSGIEIPSGNYSNATITKTDNGFAKAGYGYSFSIGFPVRKTLGLMAKLGASNQDFNATAYANQLASVNAFQTIAITPMSDYRSSYAVFGVYNNFNKNKFIINLHAGAGYLNHQSPSYKIAYTYSSNTGNDYVESKTVAGVLFNWGVQVRYQLMKNVSAGVYLDNLSSTLNKSVYTYNTSNPSTYEFKFEVYQLGANIAYQF